MVRRSRSSPETASRLISRPRTRKKTAISASLITWCRSISSAQPPTCSDTCVCQSAKYDSHHGEFAQTMASTVPMSSAAPLPASLLRNDRRAGLSWGVGMRSAGPGRGGAVTPDTLARKKPRDRPDGDPAGPRGHFFFLFFLSFFFLSFFDFFAMWLSLPAS